MCKYIYIIHNISVITKSSIGQHWCRITFVHMFIVSKKVLEEPGSNL